MTEVVFDPRDFISAPYKPCPKCGREAFGVLTISGDNYSRRCRECLHMVKDFTLPKTNKKIIYLDQYVISNLVKLGNPELQRNNHRKADPFWEELHSLLFELRRLQLIVCPDSASHVSESRISFFNAELKKTYENLSGGITFKSFEGIQSMQIIELARAWSDEREPVFNFSARRVLNKDPNEWSERYYITFQDNPFILPDEIRASRASTHAHIARLFRDVWCKERRTFQYWYDLERKSFQEHLGASVARSKRERMESVLAFQPGVKPSVKDLNRVLLSSAEALMVGLERVMRSPKAGSERTQGERAALRIRFSKANRMADAPFVKLQSMMYAAIAMRAAAGQKEPPNEGMATDIETVACLLPYCDAMLMDNDCRALLLNIPKTVRPNAVDKVYSMNTQAAFLTYLRSIRESITAEHMQALRDVYGIRCA